MRLKLYTAPTDEAITLADLKAHPAARISATTDDAWIDQLIIAARVRYEELTQRILMQSTWDLYLDEFPDGDVIELPAPLVSVASIAYRDENNGAQTWLYATGNYVIDTVSEPVARLALAYGVSWPTVYQGLNVIAVRFVAGYTAATVPISLKTWLCAWVAAVYDGNDQLQEIAESMMRVGGRWAI